MRGGDLVVVTTTPDRSVRFAVAGCRWQVLPEENRGQVSALLARMIAKGAVVDPDSHVGLEAGDA